MCLIKALESSKARRVTSFCFRGLKSVGSVRLAVSEAGVRDVMELESTNQSATTSSSNYSALLPTFVKHELVKLLSSPSHLPYGLLQQPVNWRSPKQTTSRKKIEAHTVGFVFSPT